VQLALLLGASGQGLAASATKPKLLYLEKELPELARLKTASDAKAKRFAAALDARLAWPNKPGVPLPPVIVPLTTEQQQLYDTGRTVYATLCAACHQPTGVGMPGLAPALVDSNWVLGQPEMLPRIVLHGVSGPLKVNNQWWGLEMPPLGAALSDQQIAGVLTYIRREWEHNASPISVRSVAEIREQNKSRTKAWSEGELDALAAPPPSAKK
jgi:mono/diheme cytochrome c family protein